MQHLRYLKIVNFVIGAYTLVFGMIFLFMFLLPLLIGDDEAPVLLFACVGIAAFILLGGWAAAHVLAGYLVGARRGRGLQTALALFQITSFPMGTVYAAYALWVCWIHDPTRRSFESALSKTGIT